MITKTPLPARLFLLLTTLALATSASGQNTFTARITVTSQCNAQQALFGPQAQRDVTVICQPGLTPYQTQAISLDNNTEEESDRDKTAGSAIGQPGQDKAAGAALSSPSTKKVLSPPLPTASTFASKVVFVMF